MHEHRPAGRPHQRLPPDRGGPPRHVRWITASRVPCSTFQEPRMEPVYSVKRKLASVYHPCALTGGQIAVRRDRTFCACGPSCPSARTEQPWARTRFCTACGSRSEPKSRPCRTTAILRARGGRGMRATPVTGQVCMTSGWADRDRQGCRSCGRGLTDINGARAGQGRRLGCAGGKKGGRETLEEAERA
jgi:hypothetical protein